MNTITHAERLRLLALPPITSDQARLLREAALADEFHASEALQREFRKLSTFLAFKKNEHRVGPRLTRTV